MKVSFVDRAVKVFFVAWRRIVKKHVLSYLRIKWNSVEKILFFLFENLDYLRQKFQSYLFGYRYNVDSNIDVRAVINLLDGPIRGSLEGLVSAAKKAGVFEEAELLKNNDSNSASPNSDDSGM